MRAILSGVALAALFALSAGAAFGRLPPPTPEEAAKKQAAAEKKAKEEEEKKILENLNTTKEQLPRIKLDDPAIRHLNPKKGDIIRIHRQERHTKSIYYRVVV